MEDQLYLHLKKLLIQNNIQINQEELLVQLSSHPSYPSLHAVIGVLDHFNIPNIAVRIEKDIEILKQLPKSFIAVFEENSETNIVLVNKSKTAYTIVGTDGKKIAKTSSEFLKDWNGIVVAIEKDENVIETKKSLLSKALAIAPYILGIGLFSFFITQSSLFANLHFTLSILGVILSVFLVKQDLGILSKAANSICNFSEKTSCDAILNSKGATLFGLFKLSDLSLIAFSGYCCTWLFFMFRGMSDYSTIIALTIFALPVVAYSLYYQGIILKKWCPLCLGVAGVLLLQAVTLFSAQHTLTELSNNPILIIIPVMAFLLSIIIWIPLKNLIKKNSTLKVVEIDHLKFKNNFSVFNVLLNQGTTLLNNEDIPSEIILGNPTAPLTLTLVTSPFCHYCKQAHQDITQLVQRAGDSLKIRIRFIASSKNLDSDLYTVVSHLLNTYAAKGATATEQMLHTLYADDANIKNWIKNETIVSTEKTHAIMDAQSSWCEENSVNFTPAFFIGNKPFPKEYNRTDLLNFIDELIETSISTKTEPLETNKIAS